MSKRGVAALLAGWLALATGCGTSSASAPAAQATCAALQPAAVAEQRQVVRAALATARPADAADPEQQESLSQDAGMLQGAYSHLFCTADQDSDGRLTGDEIAGAEALEVFQQDSPGAPLLAAYRPGDRPLSPARFASLMLDLAARLDAQGQGEQLQAQAMQLPGKAVPTILVQGYGEPSWYFMGGIYAFLKRKKVQVYAINLFPNIADIRGQAVKLSTLIDATLKRTNASRVNLVVHSMGGMISRYYIQKLNGAAKVDNLITIATPHYGTRAAFIGPGKGGRQMQQGSDFLKEINAGDVIVPPVKYMSIWTPTDEIIIPANSAQLLGSRIMPPVTGTEHLLILFDKRTYQYIWSAIG